MTVKSVLQNKSNIVATIKPSETIKAVLDKLADEEVGALVVSIDGKKIDGIISERDIVRGLSSDGPGILEQPVSKHMTRDVICCSLDERIAALRGLMTNNRIRHVPVVKDGLLIGIISIGDLVKARLDEVQAEADAMLKYIQTG